MPRRVRLPAHLATRPFTLAEGAESGLTRDRLRGADLARPFRGVRSFAHDPSDIRALCRAYQARMPQHQVFSHVTAARLIGLPLPLALTRERLLHVSAFAPKRAPHCTEVIGHQIQPSVGEVRQWDGGFLVTSPIRTWVDLATLLGWRDLTVIGDYLVADPLPMATVAQLADAVASAASHRGSRALRRAEPQVRCGVLSPMETVARLVMVEAGLPEPELNAKVFDARGAFLAMVDFCFRAYRVAVEYQGDYHRSEPGRYRADIVRRERLEDAGWRVIQITIDDVILRRDETLRRISDALRAWGWMAT